jgi:hypothetical protein
MKKKIIAMMVPLAVIGLLLLTGCGGDDGKHKKDDHEPTIWAKPPGTVVITKGSFGNPNANCSGRGVCSGGPTSNATLADTFSINPTNDTLTVWFNLYADTVNTQGAGYSNMQKPNFWPNADTTYAFDVPCDISKLSPLFAGCNPAWPLTAGYIIPSGVPFKAVYDAPTGDEIITIPIVKVQPIILNVIFGGTDGRGNYSATAAGIYKVSRTPIKAAGSVPASIPVTFSVAPSYILGMYIFTPNVVMCFDTAILGSTEPAQRANFNLGLGSVPFATNYPLSDPMFAKLYLPINAQINAVLNTGGTSTSYNALTCGGGWDTVRCAYGFACVPDTLSLTASGGNCMVNYTATSITVDLTKSNRPLFYNLQAVGNFPYNNQMPAQFSNTVYYPATSITLTGLQPAQTYTVSITETQRDYSTTCYTNAIVINTPASGNTAVKKK